MDPARILVVDDSLTIRRALEVILKPQGYQIEFAEDGRQAVDRACSFEPDLILLDYVLPDMRGPDVCAALRETAATAKTPVVLVSAKGASIRQAYQDAPNVVSYITKPFKPEIVLSVAENALRQPAAPVPAEAAPAPQRSSCEGVHLEEAFSTLLGQLEDAVSTQRQAPAGTPTDPNLMTGPLERTRERLHAIGQHLEKGDVVPLRLGHDGTLVNVATTLLETHRLLCEAMVALAMTGVTIEEQPPGGRVLIAVPPDSPSHESLTQFARAQRDTLVVAEDFSSLPWVVHLMRPETVIAVLGECAALDEILEQLDPSVRRIVFWENEAAAAHASPTEFETIVGSERLAAALERVRKETDECDAPEGAGLEVVNL